MRRNILNNIMLVSLLTLAGCSNETDIVSTQSTDKTPISLSVGVESANTRAVTTDGEGKTLVALPENTNIWMAMKSEKTGEAPLYSSTIGKTANPEKESADSEENDINKISFSSDNTRFWDDAYGTAANLSVWALTVPGATTVPGSVSASLWSAKANTLTLNWSLSSAQTSETVANEDLCFSNNIAADKMRFGNKVSNKFDQGKLIFYHALSKVTIILKEGDGFNTSSIDDFNFDGTGNITLKDFGLSGSATFNVATGEFGSYTSTDITSMYDKEKTASNRTLEALVMPGTKISTTSADDAVTFSIEKNPLKVSAKTLATALNGKDGVKTEDGNIVLEAGKNYKFTFTISKTGIKVITATVAAWENVEADEVAPKITINKAYGHLASDDECTDFTDQFALYLSTSKASNYSKGTDITYADSKYKMGTQLYWPNHETHYFFRGVYPSSVAVTDSKITVENGAYNSASAPSNLMIGYPRNTDGTPDEACKVHSGTQGICATEGDIRMNFQYVMSQVEVKLTTSTGADKVVLDENTTIEILGGYKSGSIKLEDGTATYVDASDKATYTMLGAVTGNDYDRHDAIIPQSLTNLKFKITVKDSDGKYDSYEAIIANIDVTPTGGSKSKITSWLPGKKYTYSLYITKTATKFTATLKDWETVTSGDNHIWM